ISLRINFASGADPFATQNRNWWAPALHRMLKEKWQYKAWNCEKLLVHQQAEDCPRESQCRCICFEPALHVPFLVQLINLPRLHRFGGVCRAHHAPRRLPVDLLIHMSRSMRPDPVIVRGHRKCQTRFEATD